MSMRAATISEARKAIADCYHDDFTLHYFGQNQFAGDHIGKPVALTTLASFAARTGRKLISIVDVMAGSSRAVIVARESFERDGRRAEFERVLVYTIRDGKLHECWVLDGDRAAVDSFLS
jgi:uncharacterized protein